MLSNEELNTMLCKLYAGSLNADSIYTVKVNDIYSVIEETIRLREYVENIKEICEDSVKG